MARRDQYCDRLRRRDFCTVGPQAFGFGLSLSQLLAAESQAAETGQLPKSNMSLIIVFLQGGLSTIDTWDMKPDARLSFVACSTPSTQMSPALRSVSIFHVSLSKWTNLLLCGRLVTTIPITVQPTITC